jgi:hypothetical protein
MRKLFYAGAVAGGFLLLGAAPAHADVVPGPAGGLLSALGGDGQGLGLDPAGGLNLESPLGGPLTDIKPGQNSADVSPAADVLPAGVFPATADRTREADQATGRRPAAARPPVLSGLTGGSTGSGLTSASSGGRTTRSGSGLGGLIPAELLGGGLTPDGRTAATTASRESALFDGGVPLLGGLGGLLPANESPRTLPAPGDDTPAGMPAGGTPVDPADPALADPDPALVDPAPGAPADTQAGNGKNKHQSKGEPVDDPRLHEEPIDDEAGAKKRTFSAGGRPIAGEDEDFR